MMPMTVSQNFLADNNQEETDLLLADRIQSSVVADNLVAWRYKTLAALNPYMANSPESLMTMASLNIPDQELFRQAGEIYGMSASSLLAKSLPSYSESYQRAIFNSLSDGQQYSLRQMGYEPPARDVHSNGMWDALGSVAQIATLPLRGIGKTLQPVLSPAFSAMSYVSEIPKQAYRTIRQLDGAEQWVALALGAAAFAATPVTFGASGSLAAALTSFGMRGLVGITAATAGAAGASAVRTGSLHSFASAWQAAADGERLFTLSGQRKAKELLQNPELERLAQELALQFDKPNSIYELAAQIAGVRGGDSQTVQLKQLRNVAVQYADEGTPEYGQVYNILSQLLNEPLFVEALQVLERSKISYGRDLVRVLNVIPGIEMRAESGVGRWISGGFDAFMSLWLDPFNFAGGAYRAYAFGRRGIQFADNVVVGARLDELAGLPEIQRKWQVVADAVNAGDIRGLELGASEYKQAFVHLLKWKADDGITTFTTDDVFNWLKTSDGLQNLSKGIGQVRGLRYPQLKGLNRTQAMVSRNTGAARDFLRGIGDIGKETTNFKRLFTLLNSSPEMQQQFAEYIAQVDEQFVSSLVEEGLDEQAARVVGVMVRNNDVKAVFGVDTDDLLGAYELQVVKRAQEFVVDRLGNTSSAYRFGRKIGAAPGGQIFKGLSSLVDGLTTQIPREFVELAGDNMALDMQKYIELYRYAGLPSYVRDAWTAALIEAPNGGARVAGLTSFLDSVATASGMRLVEDGNKLLDKYLHHVQKIYGFDDFGRYKFEFPNGMEIPLGTLPDTDMALRWAIPDLHEIRKAVNQSKLFNALLGIPESTTWKFFQNKIWKPAALLRLGFFIRNVSEEMFATLMRYGTGSWISERAATQIVHSRLYAENLAELEQITLRGISRELRPEQVYTLAQRYDLPMIYRPVARAIDRLHGGQIWQQKLYDNLDFLRRMIEDRGARVLSRMEYGVGSPKLRDVASRMLPPKMTISSRKELFERNWQKFAFGSEHSFRRMLIGGVDPKLISRAEQFEKLFAKSLLEEIGTSRLAPWESSLTAPNVKSVIGGMDVNDEEILLVQSFGERMLATRDSSIPEQQPWWNAILDRVAAPFDDEFGGQIYAPIVLWYNEDIQQSLPRETLEELLRPFAELLRLDQSNFDGLSPIQLAKMAQEGKRIDPSVVDRDLLQLWSEVNSGYFDKARFNATLRRMEVTPARMAELEKLPPTRLANGDMLPHPLLTWAETRNKIISDIRRAYPGELQPEWWEIDSIFRNAMVGDEDVWIPQSYREYEIWKDFVPHTESRKRVTLELAALENAALILRDQPPAVREWVRNLLTHWQTQPSLISPRGILEGAENARRAASSILYRGVEHDLNTTVDEFGNLIFKMRPQGHWEDRPVVSFTTSRPQARLYASTQVSNTQEIKGQNAHVIFSIRLDDMLSVLGLTVDDLNIGMYEPGILNELLETLGENRPERLLTRMQPAGSPWTMGAPAWSSGEIAVTSTSFGDDQVLIIPAGLWDAEQISFPGLSIDETDFLGEVKTHRRALNEWPFYETEDQVRAAMKAKAFEVSETWEAKQKLGLNPKWHGIENGDTYYVVDTRGFSFPQGRFSEPYVGTISLAGRNMQQTDVIYDVIDNPAIGEIETGNPLLSSGARQSPIIVKTRAEAVAIQKLLGQAGMSVPPIQLMDVPPGELADSLVPWVFNQSGVIDGQSQITLYGWPPAMRDPDGGLTSPRIYEEYPAIWNYIDEISTEVDNPVIDTFLNDLFSRIRSGRRTKLEYVGSEEVPEVWRNFGGVMHKLEPGDLLHLDDELYMTPNVNKDARIAPTDQRVSRAFIKSYDGENEVMWSIVAPTLLDRIEGATGRALVEPKTPIAVPGRRGEVAELPQIERRLRAVTKRNVENTPAADLPDLEIAQVYKPYKANVVGTKVNKLFELMGKAIDAISRKPMAFHAFNIAADRNEALIRWVVDSTDNEKALKNVVELFVQDNVDNERLYREAVEFGRVLGAVGSKTPSNISKWSDRQAFAYLKGSDQQEIIDALIYLSGPETIKRIAKAFPDLSKSQIDELVNKTQIWASSHEFVMANGSSYASIAEELDRIIYIENVDDLLQLAEMRLPEIFDVDGLPLRKPPGTSSNKNEIIDSIEKYAVKVFGEEAPTISVRRFWQAMRNAQTSRNNVSSEALKYAAEHTIRDVMPFVDSHEIRSQFSELMRGILPFWYAEENFLKRWGKILTEGGPLATLQRIERLRLTYMGLQSAGIVRSDQQGNDYFVYPGSELLAELVEKTFVVADQALPGSAFSERLSPNLEVLFQSPTDMILPGFNAQWGRPSLSPLITAPMALFTNVFPEAYTVDEALVGKEYVNRGVFERIIPASVMRVFEATADILDSEGLNPKNERTAAYMMAAMAHLQASGNGLPDENVTAEQRDDFIRRAREHARIIMISQALGGYIFPGPPTALQLVNGTSLDWITNGEITNPADLLAAEYYELISQLGIEEGTIRWLELNPSGRIKDILNPTAYAIPRSYSVSGAPLPSTEEGIQFFRENESSFQAFPEAGPWLLPQDEGDNREQYAYTSEQILGLRENQAPTEFVNAMIYREGATIYFAAKNSFDKSYGELQQAGRSDAAKALKESWSLWSASFKATHPLFALELESGDARNRRKKIIQQMRVALMDPDFPKAPHFEAMKELQGAFDAYIIARGRLGLDQTATGRNRSTVLKTQFRSWVENYIQQNPAVGSYWLTVLQPESGLD